ncbi:DUF3307 domain-containing protein [Flavobacterium terrae]|uniref:DUF3307 domain-containing protein n=1 Tax=Flavobacterium terrae TaxID=415425 RepID=A0A1M6CM04_9FLAO|nr:DUF3307 domain-containing protein [Flavobacterium terrae]SHI62065.1 Protein of unknown function [Flavobacterium terrae]
MNVNLLILQFIGHLLGDYIFQTDASAKEKNENGFKSKFIFKHTLITFISSLVLSFDFNFTLCSLGIAASHLIIDGLKHKLNKGRFSFFIDQTLHIVMIVLFVWMFELYFKENPLLKITNTKLLLIITGYLICLKPANIFIREVLVVAKIESISDTTTELKNAGKVIGILERILVLTFVIIGKLEIIGFMIAAKSILRYKDTNTIKTEYVLIGTMLSFGIAMLAGLLIERF